ncbi:DNA polymerase III subunit delta [Candidatus Peregrinibacteria bacterium]|nr:DNA polymerase III subunit delta [Candidatus Peregrinibacteria bacterium]
MGNLYLFTGEETFLLHQQVQAWKEAFRKRGEGDLNLAVIDGSRTDEAELISQIETMPFLSEKRLVFIENLPEAAKATAKAEDKEESEEAPSAGGQRLIDYVGKIPETSVVIFVQAKPDKRKSLYKKLVQHAEVKEFKVLEPAALAQWVRTQAAKRQASIDPRSVEHLIGLVGPNLWRLEQEIQKLSNYAEGKPITIEAIDELVIPSLEANVFHLTDALGAKDARKAIRNLHQVVAAGENLRQTFYMIVRQFRLLLQVAGYLSNYPTATAQSLATSLKMHPFVARNTMGQAKHFKMAELKAAYRKLLELDLAMKTSKIQTTTDNQDELTMAIEQFMLEFCK